MVGKIPVDISEVPIDAVSACAHKMHGPKGVGVLVLQGRATGRQMEPLIEGGGHERGLRSGTLDVPAIVGFGAACLHAAASFSAEAERIESMRNQLQQALCAQMPDAIVNGGDAPRVPHILNITIPSTDPDPLVDRLAGIACSSGSACGSARGEPSHVLRAIGLDDAAVLQTIRLSIGCTTTSAETAAAQAEILERSTTNH